MFESLYKLNMALKLAWKRIRSHTLKPSAKDDGKAAATTGPNSPIQMDTNNNTNNITMEAPGRGGNGGAPTINGNNGVAIGGPGGAGGQYGRGGDGGGGVHVGDNIFALGGEGGEAGQFDRGGRGGRSPFEILGAPNIQLPDGTRLWDRGRGGDGASPGSTNDPPKKTN